MALVENYAGENPREALEIFKKKVVGNIVNLDGAKLIEKRGGKIPVGGVLRRIANERGLLLEMRRVRFRR